MPSFKWLLVPATAIACALIAFFIWNAQRETPQKVEKLLAQAYTKQRTTEMRWPGAEWANLSITRGEEDPSFSKPEALLKADEILAKQSPNSTGVDWLRVRAEADILEGNNRAAIGTLTQALTEQPESIPLLLDLAIAQFQSVQTSNDPEEFASTIDLLKRVTKLDPGNRDAVFNLAICYSKAGMRTQAINSWQQYLKLDPDSEWAKEAGKRLAQAANSSE